MKLYVLTFHDERLTPDMKTFALGIYTSFHKAKASLTEIYPDLEFARNETDDNRVRWYAHVNGEVQLTYNIHEVNT